MIYSTIDFNSLRSGQTLEIPPGYYSSVAKPIGLNDDVSKAPIRLVDLEDVSIVGRGRVKIFSPTHGDIIAVKNCRNLSISNITFEGAGIIGQSETLFSAINIVGPCSHLNFSSLRIRDFGNHGISQLNGPKVATHVTISDCLFQNGGNSNHPTLKDDGAAVSGIGSDWTIRDCTVIDCLRGFEIEGAQSESRFKRISIHHNRIKNVLGTGIMVFNSPHGVEDFSDISITDNFIDGCVKPDNRSYYKSVGMDIQAGLGVQICRNICRSFQNTGMAIDGVSQVIVKDNLVKDCGWRAFQIRGSTDAMIEGNIFGYGRDTATVLVQKGIAFDETKNLILSTANVPKLVWG